MFGSSVFLELKDLPLSILITVMLPKLFRQAKRHYQDFRQAKRHYQHLKGQSGSGICLQQHETNKSFLLTLNQASYDNVLNPELIRTIRECLDVVKSKATKESVLITTGEGEVFCKGFDDSYAGMQAKGSNERYKYHYEEMIDGFKHLVSDLISLPMPTIAAINGYTQEAGVMLGLSHDYLTMKEDTRWLKQCLLAKQMTLPAYFAALIRSKVSNPLAYRDFVLCDLRFNAKEAAKIHILETEHESGNNALEVAEEKAKHLAGEQQKLDKWNGEVYAELRKALYPELCKELGLTCSTILPDLNS